MIQERQSPPPGLAEDGPSQADEEETEACQRTGNSATRASGPRQECLKLLESLIGAEAIPQWLKGSQPAFDGHTGGEMLQRDPERLLRHLRLLDRSLDGEDEVDPLLFERPVARRRKKDAVRVLSILDEIFPEGDA